MTTFPLKRNVALSPALILALLSVAIGGIEPVAAQACESFDDFEDYDAFTPPTTSCWYTFGGSGTSVVTPSMPYEGAQSLYIPAGSIPTLDWTTSSVPCESTTEAFVRLADLPTTAWSFGYNTGEFGQAGGVGPSVYVAIGNTGAATLFLDPTAAGPSQPVYSALVPGFTFAPDTWYEVRLAIDCTGTNLASVVIVDTVTSQVYGTAITSGIAISAAPELGTIEVRNSAGTDSWIDNLDVDSSLFVVPSPGTRFCADPDVAAGQDGSLDDYGYEYVEDFVYDADINQVSADLDDGFIFDETTGGDIDNDNTGFMGKGFTTGSKAFETHARIEALAETQQSLVRMAYTTGANGLPALANKGDGTDGGNFDNHVQARFVESGNDWTISIHSNVASAGLTQLQGSVSHGDPNVPTTYVFQVNSAGTSIDDTNGNSLVDDPPLGGYVARVLDGFGNVIISRNLPLGLQEVTWKDQWHVATDDSLLEADTIIDDVEEDHSSTCIYDLIGTSVVANSSGKEPPQDLVVGPIAAPTGLTAIVTSAHTTTPGEATVDLRWHLSPDDPDQSQGDFTYDIYIDGIKIGTDTATALDAGGVRYNTLVLGGQSPDDFFIQIRAVNGTQQSGLSCGVSINTATLGDVGRCGDISGLNPPPIQPDLGGGDTTAHTTATDTAAGLRGFCDSLFGDSAGSRFFCGLVFVGTIMVIALASLAAFKIRGIALLSPPMGLAAGMGIFNVLAGIWSLLVLIIMIVFCSLAIVAALRGAVFGRGARA